MKINAFKIIPFFLLLSFSISSKVFAQVGAIPAMSPGMLSGITNMSPSAKQALAAQYGMNLNDLGMLGMGDSTLDGLSQTETPELKSQADEALYNRIIEAENNSSKVREIKRDSVSMFERDYLSVSDLPIYGQFLFDGEYSTFAPTVNAPVPDNYVIGVGDSLKILRYGIVDTEMNLIVNRNGGINFPELGSIAIAGMTFKEASEFIRTRVSQEMIGAEVTISIGRLRTINVFMAGETKVPGAYSVSGLSTVSQLLFVAGGVTDIGSLRGIQVRRSNNLIATFDLYDLLTKGNAEGDIKLRSGDVIFVPTSQKNIFIDGAVRRPGRYEVKEDETISDLIEIVGGLQSRAYLKQIYIERYNQDTDVPSIINLDLTNEENLKFKIRDGDIIRIAEVSDRVKNSVILRGAVTRPGEYGWFEGIRFTDIASSLDVDFLNNVDIVKGIIVRRKSVNSYDINVIALNIRNAIENPELEVNPYLELHDEIFVFSAGNPQDYLNDLEVYNLKEDVNHPKYGEEEEKTDLMSDELKSQSNSNSNMNDLPVNDEMSDDDLLVAIYENKKDLEYDYLNKGKRRILLKPVVDKLLQQATTDESSSVVSISGAIKVAGTYPLVLNGSYQDLIDLAGGYTDDAFIEQAEIRRALVDASGLLTLKTYDLDLSKLSNTKLVSRDHLHIRSIKDWDTRDSVTLGGEVFYPGNYLISPNESLSSVIERAGGFTSESFIGGAIFTRESIKQKEREQLEILGDTIRRDQTARSMTKESEDFSVSSSEVEDIISALLDSPVYGRLIIDVPRIVGGDKSADIILQDGDFLRVPKYTNAVTVVGEVRRSGSFVIQKSYSIEDYIQLAAGMTARGDKKEMYIIRANGSVKKNTNKKSLLFFQEREGELQAGDTLVIPIKASYQTPLNLYSTVSTVIFQSIAAIAAFTTVIK